MMSIIRNRKLPTRKTISSNNRRDPVEPIIAFNDCSKIPKMYVIEFINRVVNHYNKSNKNNKMKNMRAYYYICDALQVSNQVILIALVYYFRLVLKGSDILNMYTDNLIFTACLMLSLNWHEDQQFTLCSFAPVCDQNKQILIDVRDKVLKELDYSLNVSEGYSILNNMLLEFANVSYTVHYYKIINSHPCSIKLNRDKKFRYFAGFLFENI